MVSFHTAKRLFSRVIYSPRGYVVPRKTGRILSGATVEDIGFENKTTPEGIEFVLENAFEISPSLVNLPIDEKMVGVKTFCRGRLTNLRQSSGHPEFIYRHGTLSKWYSAGSFNGRKY